MWPFFYNIVVVSLAKLLMPFLAHSKGKIASSIQGKRKAFSHLSQSLQKRKLTAKTVWFHAPSAGEFIQLQPLLETFLKNNYDCIVTYNSISAENWIKKAVIEAPRQPLHFGYMPLDIKKTIRRWLDLVNPVAVIFIKYDLWPNTIWETKKRGIPIYLVSATLHQRTKRYITPIGRSFYRNLYSHFKGIFVVDENDKRRFLKTNPELRKVEIFGDIRYDATLDQRDRKPIPNLPDWIKTKTVFILGSSWPPDESCVFPGLKDALMQFDDLVLIIAPHEPTQQHLLNSENYFSDFSLCRFSKLDTQASSDLKIILIDSIGILSALYRFGSLGYIGGGFTTGVHNVMEPCAMGLPVFFGPKHYNSGEALFLSKNGLAFPVSTAEEFKIKLFDLLNNPEKIKQLGIQSEQYIENQAGATLKSFKAIINDLERSAT